MTVTRLAEGPFFSRRSASPDILEQIPEWETWECAGPVFAYAYGQSVTLHVNRGIASLAFSDGTSVELQQGDVLTIRKGISAEWTIPAGIQNSFKLQDD